MEVPGSPQENLRAHREAVSLPTSHFLGQTHQKPTCVLLGKGWEDIHKRESHMEAKRGQSTDDGFLSGLGGGEGMPGLGLS